MTNVLFFSFDGDNIGTQIGQAVLSDDYEGLKELSRRIDAGNELINSWVASVGGQQFSTGGDQGAYLIPADKIDELEGIRQQYEQVVGATATFGVGKTLSESGKSLIAGKLTGKNVLKIYDDSVEQTLLETKDKIESGSADENEQKQGEAYLDAALGGTMKNNEHNHDNCEYCQEYDAKKEGHTEGDDCPHCQEYDTKMNQDHEHTDDCRYCAEYDSKDQSENITEEISAEEEIPAEDEVVLSVLPKPEVGDDPQGVAPIADDSTINNAMLDQNVEEAPEEIPEERFEGSEETPEDILAMLMEEGSQPQQEGREEINENIDPTELPTGDNMENNTSRTEGYSEEHAPNDMGLSEDGASNESPESILREDLDSNADLIHKERTIQKIAEALEGFKNSKDILEQAKTHAPEMYHATIAMLRAMIEMSRMLGLESQPQQAEAAPIEEAPIEDSSQGEPVDPKL